MIIKMSKWQKAREKKKQLAIERGEEEEHSNPYRHERIDMEDGRICIKYPIHITKDRLMLIERICETMDTHLDIYLKQALYEKIDSDLHSPQLVGQAFCDSALDQWNKNNDTNDYRVFQMSTLG